MIRESLNFINHRLITTNIKIYIGEKKLIKRLIRPYKIDWWLIFTLGGVVFELWP